MGRFDQRSKLTGVELGVGAFLGPWGPSRPSSCLIRLSRFEMYLLMCRLAFVCSVWGFRGNFTIDLLFASPAHRCSCIGFPGRFSCCMGHILVGVSTGVVPDNADQYHTRLDAITANFPSATIVTSYRNLSALDSLGLGCVIHGNCNIYIVTSKSRRVSGLDPNIPHLTGD